MSEIVVNGEPRPLPGGGRVADLVAVLGYAGKRIAVELNGEIVRRGCYPIVMLTARGAVLD